ncbi:MAG TPA: hypothetical protein PKW35_13500, partial [Nannocystaceae bacterium]|nr:hypothetical protein [Nannocystaceae bacterium]
MHDVALPHVACAVGPDPDPGRPEVEHRLDREGHPFADLLALPRRPVVRHLGLLVERGPDTVPDVLADDAEALLVRDGLDRRSDVSDAPADADRRDAGHERAPRLPDELRDRRGHLAHDR